MPDHISFLEIANVALESVVVIFLIRNEHRLTALETTMRIIMRSFGIKVRAEDFGALDEG